MLACFGVTEPTKDALPVAVGETIAGKYRVERVLGRGGMGVVVAAMHEKLRQRVAIKMLLPETKASENAVTRFMREARAAAAIRGEHVARVLDVGELDGGAPYIVMEYLEGRDLSEVFKESAPLPIEEAVGFVLQACEAIAEAHAAGIVHRDLKPSNLFLTRRPDGTALVKVLDFGISKALLTAAGEGTLTTASSFVGSPIYSPPEQLLAAHDVDARADIWALGTILYEGLGGRPPYVGDSPMHVASRIFHEAPTSLAELRLSVAGGPGRGGHAVSAEEAGGPVPRCEGTGGGAGAACSAGVHIRRACRADRVHAESGAAVADSRGGHGERDVDARCWAAVDADAGAEAAHRDRARRGWRGRRVRRVLRAVVGAAGVHGGGLAPPPIGTGVGVGVGVGAGVGVGGRGRGRGRPGSGRSRRSGRVGVGVGVRVGVGVSVGVSVSGSDGVHTEAGGGSSEEKPPERRREVGLSHVGADLRRAPEDDVSPTPIEFNLQVVAIEVPWKMISVGLLGLSRVHPLVGSCDTVMPSTVTLTFDGSTIPASVSRFSGNVHEST